MTRYLFILLLPALFASCCKLDNEPEANGLKPVYISYDQLLQFAQLPPQPIDRAGKIAVYNTYLFLGEINKGIHVIDISDTLNPVKLSFLSIPGHKDVTAQNDRLYADNGPHLLILNIENINQITLVSRNLYYFQPSEFFPPDYTGPFECADYANGWLLSWQQEMLNDPKCNI
jgi:hypothetical protein